MKLKDKFLFIINNRGEFEDIFLYSTLAVTICFASWFLYTTQQKFEEKKEENNSKQVFLEYPATGNPNSAKYDRDYLAYLQAQANLNKHRYELGEKILIPNATRKNIGFLIGMLLSLIGCIVIVRRIRNMGIMAEGTAAGQQFKLLTASPGVLLAVIGGTIIMTTIITTDKVEVKDYEPKMSLNVTLNKPLTEEEQKNLTNDLKRAIQENEASTPTNDPEEPKK